MGSFSQLMRLGDLVRVGRRALGEEWWRPGGPLGSAVLTFDDPAHVAAYASLHEQAHLWIHRDYDHGGWQLLQIAEAAEVGDDYVAMKRRGGIALRMFDTARTDDPVPPPPAGRLEALRAVVDTLRDAAAGDIDRFLAELVRRRVHEREDDVFYDPGAGMFRIDDLDPSAEEMAAWRALARSAPALAGIPIDWEPGDEAGALRAQLAGRALALRARDGDGAPRYTLRVDGEVLAVLDAWPPDWSRPG